jgi:hypothetical protein
MTEGTELPESGGEEKAPEKESREAPEKEARAEAPEKETREAPEKEARAEAPEKETQEAPEKEARTEAPEESPRDQVDGKPTSGESESTEKTHQVEELREAPEVAERVEKATFEPQEVVERKGDYKQSEVIEKAFVDTVEAPLTQSTAHESGSDSILQNISKHANNTTDTITQNLRDSDYGGSGSETGPSEASPGRVAAVEAPNVGNLDGSRGEPELEEEALGGGVESGEQLGYQGGVSSEDLQLEGKMQDESRSFSTVSNVMKAKDDVTDNSISNVRGDSSGNDSGSGAGSSNPDSLAGPMLTLEQALSGKPTLESEASQGEVKDVPFGPVKIVSKPESGEEAQTPVVGTAEQTMDLDAYAENNPEIAAIEAVAEAQETAAEAEHLAVEAASAEAKAEEAMAEAKAAAEAATEAEAAAQEARDTVMHIYNEEQPDTELPMNASQHDVEVLEATMDAFYARLDEAIEIRDKANADAVAKAKASVEAWEAEVAAAAEAAVLAKQAAAAAAEAEAAVAAALAALTALMGAEAAERVLSEALEGEQTSEAAKSAFMKVGETDEDASADQSEGPRPAEQQAQEPDQSDQAESAEEDVPETSTGEALGLPPSPAGVGPTD